MFPQLSSFVSISLILFFMNMFSQFYSFRDPLRAMSGKMFSKNLTFSQWFLGFRALRGKQDRGLQAVDTPFFSLCLFQTAKSTHHPHKIDDQHRKCKIEGGAYVAVFLGSDILHTTPPQNNT